MALEYRRLDIESAGEIACELGTSAAGKDLRALLLADVDIGEDLRQLLAGGLRADHGVGLARIALLDRSNPLERPLHEAVIDVRMDQCPARAGADLALVQREHDEAFNHLVEEIVVFSGDVLEEDVRRLAAELQRDRDEVLAGILHDQPARRGLAGEGDLGDARAGRQRLAGFQAKAIDDVEAELRVRAGLRPGVGDRHTATGRLTVAGRQHGVGRDRYLGHHRQIHSGAGGTRRGCVVLRRAGTHDERCGSRQHDDSCESCSGHSFPPNAGQPPGRRLSLLRDLTGR